MIAKTAMEIASLLKPAKKIITDSIKNSDAQTIMTDEVKKSVQTIITDVIKKLDDYILDSEVHRKDDLEKCKNDLNNCNNLNNLKEYEQDLELVIENLENARVVYPKYTPEQIQAAREYEKSLSKNDKQKQ